MNSLKTVLALAAATKAVQLEEFNAETYNDFYHMDNVEAMFNAMKDSHDTANIADASYNETIEGTLV